jgi:copper chaperone CopZ
MKKNVILLLLSLVFSFSAFAAKQKVVFAVPMHGEHCKKIIEKNIAFEKGVKALDFDLKKNTVAITFDNAKNTVDKLKAAQLKIGYEATLVEPSEKKE